VDYLYGVLPFGTNWVNLGAVVYLADRSSNARPPFVRLLVAATRKFLSTPVSSVASMREVFRQRLLSVVTEGIKPSWSERGRPTYGQGVPAPDPSRRGAPQLIAHQILHDAPVADADFFPWAAPRLVSHLAAILHARAAVDAPCISALARSAPFIPVAYSEAPYPPHVVGLCKDLAAHLVSGGVPASLYSDVCALITQCHAAAPGPVQDVLQRALDVAPAYHRVRLRTLRIILAALETDGGLLAQSESAGRGGQARGDLAAQYAAVFGRGGGMSSAGTEQIQAW
jgi:hypothetical protein